MNHLCRCLAACLLVLLAVPATAEVPVRLTLMWQDAGQAGAERPAPAAALQVTNLLRERAITVQSVPVPDAAATALSFTLADEDFAGPYARLRLAVSGLFLPQGDSRADKEMQFAVELVLHRDRLGPSVEIAVPLVVSSRKAAVVPFMDMPQIVEELPQRFLMAQQWMSLNQASADAVAAAPGGFALHRMISRALADFALEMAKSRSGGVLMLPATELRRTVDLYWASDTSGKRQHGAAVDDARTAPWADLREVEDILSRARTANLETPALCAEARRIVDFFDANRPPEEDAGPVDRLFPNPGSLQQYLDGRRLDIRFACDRPRI